MKTTLVVDNKRGSFVIDNSLFPVCSKSSIASLFLQRRKFFFIIFCRNPSKHTGYRQLNFPYVKTHIRTLIVVDEVKFSIENSRR